MTQTQQARTVQTNWLQRVRGATVVLGVGAALMAAAASFDVHAESHRMHKGDNDGAPAEMWMGPLGGQGKHAERFYKRFNITPEQQVRLQALAKTQKTERAAARVTHQALHKDMQAFLNQPTWDEAQEKTLHARAMALHQDMSEKRWQHMMAMAKVLTPEQRKQVTTMMEKRMSQHENKRDHQHGDRHEGASVKKAD